MAGSNAGNSITRRSVGRPTKIDEMTLKKLEEAFAIGANDKEACFYANISPAALYKYQERFPEFVERKEALKLRPVLMARQTVMNNIGTDVDVAKWYLERKMKGEFSTKTETDITSAGESIVPNLVRFVDADTNPAS